MVITLRSLKIVPKRGNPSEQTYYIETRDFNGNTISGSKTATVFVPSELDPVVRLLASDAYGSKTWTWGENIPWDNNGTIVLGSWGNFGYTPGSGDTFVVIHSPTVSGGLALLQN